MQDYFRERITAWVQSFRQRMQGDKKTLDFLLLLGLAGMALLCLSEWLPADSEPQEPAQTPVAQESGESYTTQLETRLEEMITEVDGAGRCRVMVTLAAGEETVYATDTEEGENTSRSEHVLLGEQALVESVQSPQIQGVAVVCEGGGDIAVQNTVTELIRALTGIGANHITVTKMVTSP